MAEILETKETNTIDMNSIPSQAKANAGLTLGIIGTALAAFSGAGALGGLFGNRNSNGMTKEGYTDAMLNIERAQNQQFLETTRGLYRNKIDDILATSALKQEMSDNTFMLYKDSRDNYDALNNRISALEKDVAVNTAVRPYQDALLNAKIDGVAMNSGWALQLGLSNCIKGVVTLPDLPISGIPSYTSNGYFSTVNKGEAASTTTSTQNNG